MCSVDINIPFLKIITSLSYRYIYRYALCRSKCDMRIKLIKLKIYNRNFKLNSLFLISDSFYFYPVLCAFEPYGLCNMEITFVFVYGCVLIFFLVGIYVALILLHVLCKIMYFLVLSLFWIYDRVSFCLNMPYSSLFQYEFICLFSYNLFVLNASVI